MRLGQLGLVGIPGRQPLGGAAPAEIGHGTGKADDLGERRDILSLLLLAKTVRVIPQARAGVVERLGRRDDLRSRAVVAVERDDVGASRRLKEFNPTVKCISLQPDAAFHGLEGWKHMQTAIRPAIYDQRLADENLEVGTEEAYRMVKRLAREEGLLVSPSAAAAMLGCFQVAEGLAADQRAVIVTVFADSASKYLTERFWDEE